MNRWKRNQLSLVLSTTIGASLFAVSPAALPVDQYVADFNDLYGTAGTVLDGCLVCHVSPTGGNRNDYGNAFAAAKISNDPVGVQAALVAIEFDDSDGDTIINIDEINALTFPGDCTDPDPTACGANPEPPPGTITEGPTLLGCYKWDRFPDERFALSVKRYAGLVTTEPRNDFIEAQNQTNHGVHGKHVGLCGSGTIGAVGGTFLKAKGIGSKIGLRTLAVRGDGSMDMCREVVIDCVSEEDVQLPTEFECRSRNEFDVFHGKSELKLVENSADDPLCQAFDGFPATPAAGEGSASGLREDRGQKRETE
ncbi:MAG: hypothetical protein U9Q81_19630 [Pseudomonadota bacterium]|nr:hypothetical protein [Pseudomonadota bacterium]